MTTPNTNTSTARDAGQTTFPTLSYDGCGINGRDEYRTRIATFTPAAAKEYGPLFEAAPELLAACQRAETLINHLFEVVPWGKCFNLNIAELNETPIDLAKAIARATKA